MVQKPNFILYDSFSGGEEKWLQNQGDHKTPLYFSVISVMIMAILFSNVHSMKGGGGGDYILVQNEVALS